LPDTIARLAERVARDPRGVGPTGFEFAAAPKATLELVWEAEEQLGFALPPLLPSGVPGGRKRWLRTGVWGHGDPARLY
jgi:hypothetical protein